MNTTDNASRTEPTEGYWETTGNIRVFHPTRRAGRAKS